MRRDDWTGIGVSLGVHAVLLLLLALMVGAQEPPQPLGMIAVEIGPFEQAQPAAPAPRPRPQPPQPRPQAEPTPPRPQPQPPTRLPDPPPAPEPEEIPPPPREQPPADPTPPAPPQPEPQEESGGTPEATTGTGSSASDTGTGTTRRAPFSIEGLDRSLVSYPLPSNPGARGTAVVNVCVAPNGSVTRAWPAQRSGTPALDQAAQAALRRWRFNALPPAAPQTEQCGRVTFRFTLG